MVVRIPVHVVPVWAQGDARVGDLRATSRGGVILMFYSLIGSSQSGAYKTGAEIAVESYWNGTHIVVTDQYDTYNLTQGQVLGRGVEIWYSHGPEGPYDWEGGSLFKGGGAVSSGKSGGATIVDTFIDAVNGRPVQIDWVTIVAGSQSPLLVGGGETYSIDLRGFIW